MATIYNGSYRHGVDEKRRVQIPAKWRPSEPGVELTLLVWPQSEHGPCLRVLSPQQMAALMQDLNNMQNDDPQKVVLKRFLGTESAQAPLDKAGRVCIPDAMAKAVGVTDEALLVGLLDRFEIWSPERYEKVKASDSVKVLAAIARMG